MTERSTALFWALVLGALTALAGVVVLAAALAGHVAAQAARAVAAISDCAMSITDTRSIALATLIPAGFGVASIIGLLRVSAAYRRERRLLRSLPLERLHGGPLEQITRTNGIPVYRTPAERPAAFCFGLLRPRIVVTSGLIACLTDDELAAAVWHEIQHARVREPLRCFLARLIANSFFWLPVLNDLFDRYTLTRELDADRVASARTSRHALAGALHEVVAGPSFAGAVGFSDLAAARVDRLLAPAAPLPSIFRRTRVALSIGALAIFGLGFAYPANVAVAKHTHEQPMMMRVPMLTSSGFQWKLVPCMNM